MDCAAVYDSFVCDRNVIPDGYGGFLVSAVYDGSILDVYIAADTDRVNVSADNRVKPDTAVITCYNVTRYGCIVGEETVPAEYGFYACN